MRRLLTMGFFIAFGAMLGFVGVVGVSLGQRLASDSVSESESGADGDQGGQSVEVDPDLEAKAIPSGLVVSQVSASPETGLVVAGSVADPAGIASVGAVVANGANFWDGAGWIEAEVEFALPLGDPGTTATGFAAVLAPEVLTEGASYSIDLVATGSDGSAVGSFSDDVVVGDPATSAPSGAPASTIQRPFDTVPFAPLADLVVRGYSRDPDGIAELEAVVTDMGDMTVWDGTAWVEGSAAAPVDLAEDAGEVTSWSITIPAGALTPGRTIRVEALATDTTGVEEHLAVLGVPEGEDEHSNVAHFPIYAPTDALRVWMIGDSTVQGGSFGSEPVAGVRHELLRALENADCEVDFVGGIQTDNQGTNSVSDWSDRQHDALAAWSHWHFQNPVAFAWDRIPSPTGNTPMFDAAALAQPDVVLIQLGINGVVDETQDDAANGLGPTENAQQRADATGELLGGLIGEIRAAAGDDVEIHMAQIAGARRPAEGPPFGGPMMLTEPVNSSIAEVAEAEGVGLVDLTTGWDIDRLTVDGLHPSSAGARELSERWQAEMASGLAGQRCPAL